MTGLSRRGDSAPLKQVAGEVVVYGHVVGLETSEHGVMITIRTVFGDAFTIDLPFPDLPNSPRLSEEIKVRVYWGENAPEDDAEQGFEVKSR